MFCTQCGNKSLKDQKFCSNCGNVFTDKGTSNNADNSSTESGPEDNRKGNYRSKIIGVIVVVVFIALRVYNNIDSDTVRVNNEALESYESGDEQQAITQFEEATKLAVTNENKVNSLKNLAYVYSSESQDAEALSSFKEALLLVDKNSFDYFLISGEIALLEKNPKLALAHYNTTYKMNPNDFQINNSLALFYMDIDEIAPEYSDYTKALSYALKAYELSKLEVAKQNLAIAYYFNENYDKALSLFYEFDIQKEPYTAYWLGMSYLGKNDEGNAKLYLKKAINAGVEVPQEVLDYVK